MGDQKTILITGASSGIGKATALWLGELGHKLILCGRRREKLEEVAKALKDKAEVVLLTFDVREHHAVQKAISNLPDEFSKIQVLINNAGNAHGLAPIHEGSLADWEAMIDGNVKGLLYVSREVIPAMIANGGGHIINIGSIAGKEVYPNGNVYCASKFAVDALNQGMRMDLFKHGIRVSAINPGLVETEFSQVRFKGDREKAAGVYKGYQPLKAHDLAEIIAFVISRPPHVNLADVLVLPLDQASSTLVNRSM
jgi:NADP-dependent 3-hydroxy acid dehydrogenase YdfG